MFTCQPCLFACQQFSRILELLNIWLPVTHSVTDRSPQFATSLGHQKAESHGSRLVSQHCCDKRPFGRQAHPAQKAETLSHSFSYHHMCGPAPPFHGRISRNRGRFTRHRPRSSWPSASRGSERREDRTRAFHDVGALAERVRRVWRSRVRNGRPVTLSLPSPGIWTLMVE